VEAAQIPGLTKEIAQSIMPKKGAIQGVEFIRKANFAVRQFLRRQRRESVRLRERNTLRELDAMMAANQNNSENAEFPNGKVCQNWNFDFNLSVYIIHLFQ
jgi:hypothetical protein